MRTNTLVLSLLGVALVIATGLRPTAANAQSTYPYGFPLPGSCYEMFQAGYGTANRPLWYGRYSGRYIDIFDRYWPLFSAGCFHDERSCRRWTNGVQSYASLPGAMSCRVVTGGPDRRIRTVVPRL